jgi:hypothetical protein
MLEWLEIAENASIYRMERPMVISKSAILALVVSSCIIFAGCESKKSPPPPENETSGLADSLPDSLPDSSSRQAPLETVTETAQTDKTEPPQKESTPEIRRKEQETAPPVIEKEPADDPVSDATAPQQEPAHGALVVAAVVQEIPGVFPPNDLYNYVYVMKYRVIEVREGSLDTKEILVGHYNPLMPREQIRGDMDQYVDGDVESFKEGDRHLLTIDEPITDYWDGALEDEYFDSDETKYFALRADPLR